MSGPLDPLTADLPPGAVGLFTTRWGGVSTGRWAELNLGRHVDDDPGRVQVNRDRLADHLGGRAVTFAHQVHGPGVWILDADPVGPAGAGVAPEADALVSRAAASPIGVLVADCLPVLFADVTAGVVAAAHAGRRGLAAGVLPATIEAMLGCGATRSAITAVVGPGVCGRCYEVPAAMRDDVAAVLPEAASTTRAGTPSLDLPAAAVSVLRRSEIGDVHDTGVCTAEDPRFFSYRRDGQTGRFAGVVVLTGTVT